MYHQKHFAGLSQQCYSAPNCVAGTEIAAGSSTPNDSCAGTNEGQSYANSGGSCVVGQCIVDIILLQRTLVVQKLFNHLKLL